MVFIVRIVCACALALSTASCISLKLILAKQGYGVLTEDEVKELSLKVPWIYKDTLYSQGEPIGKATEESEEYGVSLKDLKDGQINFSRRVKLVTEWKQKHRDKYQEFRNMAQDGRAPAHSCTGVALRSPELPISASTAYQVSDLSGNLQFELIDIVIVTRTACEDVPAGYGEALKAAQRQEARKERKEVMKEYKTAWYVKRGQTWSEIVSINQEKLAKVEALSVATQLVLIDRKL
ncbi:MAG: hypothetical protein HS115_20045 [Spirochaetales bacterium]|nr:hypothetical protein [Spirochaetales bacterium]